MAQRFSQEVKVKFEPLLMNSIHPDSTHDDNSLKFFSLLNPIARKAEATVRDAGERIAP
jgi:hypothetical protein